MSIPAIVFDNVSKRYRLGALSAGNLRWAIPDPIRVAARWLRRGNGGPDASASPDSKAIWALRDVSFEVQPGEALGIIGPNGAGKTTVLKILAGITEPTSGRVQINGRLSCLIELGAGFHPDLTGRENLYLQGSILGMTRQEVARKFDDIVSFAELERFLDTPVKRYSTGMQARLGFSIAMHVDPDVLLVDEVLSVGDLQFQRKCISAMREFRQRAQAILFVSHNMAAMTGLCQRCIWIDSGRVRTEGDSGTVTSHYVAESRRDLNRMERTTGAGSGVWGTGEVRIVEVGLRGPNGDADFVRVGDPLRVEMVFDAKAHMEDVFFWACLVDAGGVKVAGSNSARDGASMHLTPGRGQAVCEFPSLPLAPGRYSIAVGVFDRRGPVPYHRVGAAAYLDVVGPADSGPAGLLGADYDGLLHIPSQWSIEQTTS